MSLTSRVWAVAAVACLAAVAHSAEPPITPDGVLGLVAKDLAAASYPRSTRYLSLHNLPDEKTRDLYHKVICGHLQTLSDNAGVVLPARSGVLLRIDTSEYGETFAAQWERLGAQEPYWHGDTVVPTRGYEEKEFGYYYDRFGRAHSEPAEGRTFRATETRRAPTTEVQKSVHLFFVRTPEGKKALEEIEKRTGGTDVPVVTAEWFLTQTAVNFKRDPGFYAFAGIRDLRSYERLIGFTRKDIDPSFLQELREAVSASTVTGPDTLRRIVRRKSLGGGYWFTQDANQRQAGFDPRANPLSNLGDDYVFQAIEAIGYRANGFPLTGLFNQAGVIQDVAPDFIASDSTAPYADRRVHVNLGCTRCHANGYLQDVKGWVRGVLNKAPNFLAAKDPDGLRDLRQQYATQHVEPHLKADRDAYAAALWSATGMKPAEYAAAYAEAWKRAAEDAVTVQRAALDLGCTAAAIEEKLKAEGGRVDPPLAAFRLPDPETIPVVAWQQSFQRAADVMYGQARPFSVKEK